MTRVRIRTFAQGAAAAALVASGVAMVAGQQVLTATVFTTQQATAGRAAYARSCASCHMPDMSGNNEIPALTGTAFTTAWGHRSTKDLFDYMSAAMPYGAPSLTPETYTSIEAYILEFNGAVAGPHALSASTVVPIASVIRARPASE